MFIHIIYYFETHQHILFLVFILTHTTNLTYCLCEGIRNALKGFLNNEFFDASALIVL